MFWIPYKHIELLGIQSQVYIHKKITNGIWIIGWDLNIANDSCFDIAGIYRLIQKHESYVYPV